MTGNTASAIATPMSLTIGIKAYVPTAGVWLCYVQRGTGD